MEASAEAWTSLAFSTDFNMAGSDAVAGLPDDLAVLEYDLQGYVRKSALEACGE